MAFGDKELLQMLCTSDVIYGDGAFSVVPEPFYQLYTLHSKIGNSYPALVYFLLRNKDEKVYLKMITLLKQLVPNIHPSKIVLDFEKAALNAFVKEFPMASISGCHCLLYTSPSPRDRG